MIIVTKIMVFLMVFASLNIISNIMDVIKAYIQGEGLKKTIWDKLILGTSISYIMTIIITGFQLF